LCLFIRGTSEFVYTVVAAFVVLCARAVVPSTAPVLWQKMFESCDAPADEMAATTDVVASSSSSEDMTTIGFTDDVFVATIDELVETADELTETTVILSSTALRIQSADTFRSDELEDPSSTFKTPGVCSDSSLDSY